MERVEEASIGSGHRHLGYGLPIVKKKFKILPMVSLSDEEQVTVAKSLFPVHPM